VLHRQINWLVLTDWHRTGVAPKIVEMAITNKNQSWFITVVGKFKNTLDKDINVLDKTNTAIGPRSSIFIFQAIDYWPNTFVWIYMSAAIPGTKQTQNQIQQEMLLSYSNISQTTVPTWPVDQTSCIEWLKTLK